MKNKRLDFDDMYNLIYQKLLFDYLKLKSANKNIKSRYKNFLINQKALMKAFEEIK